MVFGRAHSHRIELPNTLTYKKHVECGTISWFGRDRNHITLDVALLSIGSLLFWGNLERVIGRKNSCLRHRVTLYWWLLLSMPCWDFRKGIARPFPKRFDFLIWTFKLITDLEKETCLLLDIKPILDYKDVDHHFRISCFWCFISIYKYIVKCNLHIKYTHTLDWINFFWRFDLSITDFNLRIFFILKMQFTIAIAENAISQSKILWFNLFFNYYPCVFI